jgi:dihydroflavonol-4-reductase
VSPVAAVTGASGFVGGAVTAELLAAGYEVRALVRSRAAEAAVGAIGDPSGRPIAVPGNILEVDSMIEAFDGAGLVVHAAGIVAACRRDPSAMLVTNVVGTRNAVVAAARAGARRLVLTSSAAALGEPAGEVGREDTVHRGWFLSAYERSKTQAEAAAFALGRDLGLDVVAVNPASVQGPGRIEGTARLLLAAARGRLPLAVRSTLSFVDVADCARGHLLAATRGRAGERYVLCGATMTVDEALALLGRITGRRRRPLTLPRRAFEAAAGVVEAGGRLLHVDPPICREVAAAVAHGRAYDGSKASRELGLAYTPAEQTFRRTLAWLRTLGALR